MDDSGPKAEIRERFFTWAIDQGILMSGVKPVNIPGRGIGIVAERRINVEEKLIFVPKRALLTEKSLPVSFTNRIGEISIHGLLAAFLTFGNARSLRQYEAWSATWPSMDDFRKSMPILWPEHLRTWSQIESNIAPRGFFPLPPAIGGWWASLSTSPYQCQTEKGLLHIQEQKLDRDWAIVSQVFRKADRERYMYNWLLVNTRSFYYDLSHPGEPRVHEDRMVLCPVVDCFNHADQGCDVMFNEKGFTVCSDKAYEEGEELFVSYGSHSNDFLLTEYGFMLSSNKWDSLPLDDLLFLSMKTGVQKRLCTAGYLGNYTLNNEGVCYRTQVAIRTKTLVELDWKLFVQGRKVKIGIQEDESRADSIICREILCEYHKEVKNCLECLEDSSGKTLGIPDEVRKTLVERWIQIKLMIKEAFINGINSHVQATYRQTLTSVDDLSQS